MHLGLVSLLQLTVVSLALRLRLLDLSTELFLLECDTLPLELDLLEFFAVLFAKCGKLLLLVPELDSLLLVLLIDSQETLEITLNLADLRGELSLS